MSSEPPSIEAEPGREDEVARLLSRVLLFSELTEAELLNLAAFCTTRWYDPGDVVWHAGDEADELLVVASGELEVRGAGPRGREEILGKIRPGECVGEMAIVLNERRSATVITGRRAQTVVLRKDDFSLVVRDNNRLLTSLTKLLSQRAMSLARRQPVSVGPLVVGVTGDPSTRGTSLVAGAMAEQSARILGGRTLLVTIIRRSESDHHVPHGTSGCLRTRGTLAPEIEVSLGPGDDDGEAIRSIKSVVHTHGDEYGVIVVDLPRLSAPAFEALEALCNRRVHIVGRPSSQRELHTRTLQVVNTHGTAGASVPRNHCEPFVLPAEPRLEGADAQTAARILTDAVTPFSRVVGRLTRKVLGVTIGMALGGGGAFGIAHVGVLAALADAGIPIDLVAGTSMGSIIAIGYAAGLDPSRMEEIAGQIGNVRTALSAIDPSLSGTGLLNGKRLVSIFSPLIPQRCFEDLEVPCRVVAMDVETGERVDIGSGRLDEAFRASCSVPVIFKPVQLGGRTLVDGGMIDPVPSDVVHDMGADITIAVNVVPQLRRGVSTAISRGFKHVSRLNPLTYVSGIRNAPDIVDVFMNSLQTTEHELGHYKSLAADVLINVDMAEFTWIDFHRARNIIARGRVAGEQFAPAVRAVIDERLTSLLSA